MPLKQWPDIPVVPNREILIAQPRLYTQKSVQAGKMLDVRLSSSSPYKLSIARLGWDFNTSAQDWILQSLPQAPAIQRSIRPGSYIHVARSLASDASYPQLTLECWVRLFEISTLHGLITQYTYPGACGFGLFIGRDGSGVYAAYYFGNGASYNPNWLSFGATTLQQQDQTQPWPWQWYHLAAVFDAGNASLYVNGQLDAGTSGLPQSVIPGTAPLRIGAFGDASGTSNFLEGDIAMPAIYARALTAEEIQTRANTTSPQVADAAGLLGCWPLTEEMGPAVHDVGPSVRTGTIVNRGTWMIGGPGFRADKVSRFYPYDPDTDSKRGHALRLSSNDLYDFAWPVSHQFPIPADLPPGLYVARIDDGNNPVFHSTFVVRREPSRPEAPIGVLCATNTWHAYNELPHLGLPFCFYVAHDAGQPTYQVGFEVPWATAGEQWTGGDPYGTRGDPTPGEPAYAHLVRAERYLHVWLEQNGYDYDVFSDRDLHLNPDLLHEHRVLIIAGHSEYWSTVAYDAVQDYLAGGGRVIVASGNTMFWRVSYDDEVIECRKFPKNSLVGGFDNATWGELYHQHDHKRGGLMREAGSPAWQAIGLEPVGYDFGFGPFKVKDAAHSFFNTPEVLGLSMGDALGTPEVVRHEFDVTLQWIKLAPTIPASYKPIVLASRVDPDPDPGGNAVNYFDYQANLVDSQNRAISEMIDWSRDDGGRVFASGTINTAGSLHSDPNMSGLFRNVLHQFGVVFHLNVLAIDSNGHFRNKWFDGQNWGPSIADWQDMGAGFVYPPAGIQWAPDQISIMAVTATGSLHYAYWDGANWSDWSDMGGGNFLGRPAPVAWGRNRLEIFVRRGDGHLCQKSWDGSGWTDWQDIGGSVASDPAAIAWEGNRLGVAVRGAAGNIQYKWWANGAWGPSAMGWDDMGGNFAYAPTLVAWAGRRINIFAVDGAGRLWNKWWDGNVWKPSWQDLGGTLAGRVAVAVRGGNQLSIFGVGQDGMMKVKWWDGAVWGPSALGWEDMGGTFTGEPSAASFRGQHVSLIVCGTDGHAHHALWNGKTWSAWQDMGGSPGSSPAVFRWLGN